jgi:hypothetical protein
MITTIDNFITMRTDSIISLFLPPRKPNTKNDDK